VLERDEAVVIDMEAGLEQFGRATCRGVDVLIVVVEPGTRSVDTAAKISHLAKEMGIRRLQLVANRVLSEDERSSVTTAVDAKGLGNVYFLPYSEAVKRADLLGVSPFEVEGSEEWIASVRRFSKVLLSEAG
jgi:CO dehydrogenase maturation factor